jgi:hypothetical protein
MSVHTSQPQLEEPSSNGEQTPDSTPVPVKFDWKMLTVVILIVVFIREISVWLMAQMGYANLGNFLGLFARRNPLSTRRSKLNNTQRRDFCISTDLCGHRHTAGGFG